MFGKKTLSESDVLEALRGVKDPDLHRDLVELGMIKDIKIGEGTLSLMVNLTTPACPLKAQIENDVRTTLASRLGSALKVDVRMGAEGRGKGVRGKADSPAVRN